MASLKTVWKLKAGQAPIACYMDVELKRQLIRRAAAEHRTLSSLIRSACSVYIRAAENEPAR